MLINVPDEYPDHDHDEAAKDTVFPEPECYENALLLAPTPHDMIHFCPLPVLVQHLKWWVM